MLETDSSESDFPPYETYYLTWYDSNYGNLGPFGEPLPSLYEGLYNDSLLVLGEAKGDFYSNYQFANGVDGINSMEEIYNRSDNWLGDLESYFAGSWAEYAYEPQLPGLDEANKPEMDEEHQSSYQTSDDFFQPTYLGFQLSGDSWYEDNVERDSWGNKSRVQEEWFINSWDEVGFMERIFGHSPCLSRLDEEGLV